jgi:hypothetical protein
MNTLQRNIDGYIKGCDSAFSNEAFIEMMDKARAKATKATKATKAKGGRRRTKRKLRK